MDVHRCRFVPYPQSTINVLAFSHAYVQKSQEKKVAPPRLAVGRANGDIEIWNPLNAQWHQETVIKGGVDRSIDGLVWIQDPTETIVSGANRSWIVGKSRLFSVGCTTTVTEWDLENGTPLRHASGNHGEIWCLAAQPAVGIKDERKSAERQWEGQNLVAGCTDGALVLYSTKDEDLQFGRILVRPSVKKAKIISVAFQNRNVVIAGCTDSTIRVFDIRNGSTLRTMSLGSGPKGGPKNIDVWAVRALPDGDIISGDSTGELRIWSGKTYTLTQRVKSHNQDIFTLAVSNDGSIIFSGGKDRRTVVYKQAGKVKRWVEVSHRRYHKHDVMTMASLEYKGMSVVVSGGPDASPTVVPLQQFGLDFQRSLPFLPQEAPVKGAVMGKKRLLMSFWDREIHIWELSKPHLQRPENLSEGGSSHNRKLVSKILIKGEANILSADLSSDGSILAVSTTTEIKVFHLKQRRSTDGEMGFRVSAVHTPHSFSSGARLVRFSPDKNWLCIVRTDNRIVLRRIVSSASGIKFHPYNSKLDRVDRKTPKHVILGGLGSYDRTVTQTAFSSDSRILAVSDLAGYIDTFVLLGAEDLGQASIDCEDDTISSTESSDSGSDSEEEAEKVKLTYGQYWTRNPSAASLPKLPHAVTVLSFRPTTAPLTNGNMSHTIPTRHNPNPLPHDLPHGEDRLIVITATSDIFELEVLRGSLSEWSRRNPPAKFPIIYRKVKDLAKGCFWDLSNGRERFWLYGAGWLFMFDLSRDVSPGEEDSNAPKRKRYGKTECSGAGGAVSKFQQSNGISRRMAKVEHETPNKYEDLFARQQRGNSSDDEDIVPLRQTKKAKKEIENGEESGNSEKVENGEAAENGVIGNPEPNYWRTFKYRPILGMCAYGNGEPEVAIVERPLWEADLPDKYDGDQEWDHSGV
ncbi:WD40-repeat-containing domain protein [Calycina marina]|uniref:WD40-repeat-containing domain protein n=1 Tax=Calycina marina TaxID=1763456 RepID=A0A9P7Z7N5_9HELO|nr:WD40-repeat-containing domain protein [Calycina marina]